MTPEEYYNRKSRETSARIFGVVLLSLICGGWTAFIAWLPVDIGFLLGSIIGFVIGSILAINGCEELKRSRDSESLEEE